MELVPVPCTPALVVPVVLPTSTSSPPASVMTRQFLQLRTVLCEGGGAHAAIAYLGALFALVGTSPFAVLLGKGTVLTWRLSSTTTLSVSDLEVEIAMTLSMLASMTGSQGEREARSRLPAAAVSFRTSAAALDLCWAHVKRSRTPQWPLELQAMVHEDFEARAAFMRLLAYQCEAGLGTGTWLGIIKEYNRLASVLQPPWAILFARGHATYWLMLCAQRAYKEHETETTPTGLYKQEQMLALAVACAKSTALAFESQPSILDKCRRISDWAAPLVSTVREERFRRAINASTTTPTDAMPTEVDFSIDLNLFGVQAVPVTLSGSFASLWSEVRTEAQLWTALCAQEGPPKVVPSMPVPPLTNEMLLGPSALPLTVREKSLVMLGTLVERERWLTVDTLTTREELEDVRLGLEQAKKLIIVMK